MRNADESFERALQLQQSGDWRAAEDAYRRHLKQYGPQAEVLANLGAVLVGQDRFADAMVSYREGLRLAPQLLPLRLNLGLAFFKSGQLAPAAQQFTVILEKQPRHSQARQLRAICNFELERYEEAAKDYAELMPSADANVRIRLPSAYLRLKRYRESRQTIDTPMDRDSAPVKLRLGQMHVENGQWEQAVPLLKRALELDAKMASRCFRQSQRLHCGTCHDPHAELVRAGVPVVPCEGSAPATVQAGRAAVVSNVI